MSENLDDSLGNIFLGQPLRTRLKLVDQERGGQPEIGRGRGRIPPGRQEEPQENIPVNSVLWNISGVDRELSSINFSDAEKDLRLGVVSTSAFLTLWTLL